MLKLNREARAVVLGVAFLIVFALGLYLGAKVEQGLRRPEAVAAAEARHGN